MYLTSSTKYIKYSFTQELKRIIMIISTYSYKYNTIYDQKKIEENFKAKWWYLCSFVAKNWSANEECLSLFRPLLYLSWESMIDHSFVPQVHTWYVVFFCEFWGEFIITHFQKAETIWIGTHSMIILEVSVCLTLILFRHFHRYYSGRKNYI